MELGNKADVWVFKWLVCNETVVSIVFGVLGTNNVLYWMSRTKD